MKSSSQSASPCIMLAGGGNENDSRPLNELFASWIGEDPLLYLPIAQIHQPQMRNSLIWLRDVFGPLGVTDITAWNELTGHTVHDMERFTAVYIGGGNTFYLLQQLRLTGFDRILVDFIHSGKAVYGGSAGAIILGHDITPCAHIDEDVIGMNDLSGLELVSGCSVWCHYTRADNWRIQDYVERDSLPVIALSERSGVYRQGDQLFAAGFEPTHLFEPDREAVFEPGQEILFS